jgi:hypothetical protein
MLANTWSGNHSVFCAQEMVEMFCEGMQSKAVKREVEKEDDHQNQSVVRERE